MAYRDMRAPLASLCRDLKATRRTNTSVTMNVAIYGCDKMIVVPTMMAIAAACFKPLLG